MTGIPVPRPRPAVTILLTFLIASFALAGLLISARPAAAGGDYLLRVEKQTFRANGQDQVAGFWSFDFSCQTTEAGATGCENTFSLTQPQPGRQIDDFVAGSVVTLTETTQDAGYTTTVTCTRGGNEIASGANEVVLDAIGATGGDVTCTFVNTQVCPTFPVTVNDASDLNTAIYCYNQSVAPGEYLITLGAQILLSGSTTPVDNPTDGLRLRIEGGGNAIDAQGIVGILPLKIEPGSDVALEDLSIIRARRSGEPAGAIDNAGTLALDLVRLEDNRSDAGAGITNIGSLEIARSELISNTADGPGGAIFNVGQLHVETSTLAENTAEAGGAILSYEGGLTATLSISATTFYSNTATDFETNIGPFFNSGGALSVFGSVTPVTIVNSTFTDNQSLGNGGAIFVGDTDARITNSTFVRNPTTRFFPNGVIVAGFGFCFTADMQVSLADGSTKRIADLVPGDRVLSHDFESRRDVVNTVEAVGKREVVEIVHLNGIETTAEHPFAIGPDEWRAAGDLEVGDRVLTAGGWTRITEKRSEVRRETVYNITVSGTHNYYVSNGDARYLVHNKLVANVDDYTLRIDNTIITGDPAREIDTSIEYTLVGANNLLDLDTLFDCSPFCIGAVTNLDPVLADNAGPTWTHALLPGSNAIDAGDDTLAVDAGSNPLLTDQRGRARVRGAAVDVGAYEAKPEVLSVCPDGHPDVANELITLLGVGAGSTTQFVGAPTIVVPNSGEVTGLYAQYVGKQVNRYRYVRFFYANGTYVNDLTKESPAQPGRLFWFGQDLNPTRPISKIKARLIGATTAKPFVPRAFLLYPTYAMDEPYASVAARFVDSSAYFVDWQTALGFPQTFAPVLRIPPTQAETDITVQVALVDVDGDGRRVTLEAEAGGVDETRTISKWTNGRLLNLVTFVLKDVPPGTDEVTITLVSPDNTGDSAGMVGATASYACALPEGQP